MGHGNLFAHMHIVSTGTHLLGQEYPQSHLQNWINTGTRERKVTVAKRGNAIETVWATRRQDGFKSYLLKTKCWLCWNKCGREAQGCALCSTCSSALSPSFFQWNVLPPEGTKQSIAPRLEVGAYECLPTVYQNVVWLDLVETITGAVNSWMPQLCHVQKTLCSSGPPQSVALIIFLPLPPQRPLDSGVMVYVIWMFHLWLSTPQLCLSSILWPVVIFLPTVHWF